MKKLLLLSALLIFACSSDDSPDNNDNGGNLLNSVRNTLLKRTTVDGSLENYFFNPVFDGNIAEGGLAYNSINNCYTTQHIPQSYVITNDDENTFSYYYTNASSYIWLWQKVSENPLTIEIYTDGNFAHTVVASSISEVNQVTQTNSFECCNSQCEIY
jgi:hypothetical protein